MPKIQTSLDILQISKPKTSFPFSGYNGLKNRAIAAEADKVALKGEIACVGEEVGRLDKAATRLLREKHEMWQSISVSYAAADFFLILFS